MECEPLEDASSFRFEFGVVLLIAKLIYKMIVQGAMLGFMTCSSYDQVDCI